MATLQIAANSNSVARPGAAIVSATAVPAADPAMSPP